MDKELLQRIAITVNTYIPEFVEYYLEDNQTVIDEEIKQTQLSTTVLNLVITLKHWANPDGGYCVRLPEAELSHFNDLITILNQPKKLLAQEPFFSSEAEKITKELICAKLNNLADELIKKYHLAQAIKQEIKQDESAQKAWWNNKTELEKARIRQDYDNLSQDQKSYLTQKLIKEKVIYVYDPLPDPFLFYWMCTWQANLNFHHYHHFPNLFNGYYSSSGWSSSPGGSCDGQSSNDAGGALLAVGFIALLSSGLVGGIYAAKKLYNSTVNLFTGNKMLRSLYRLAGIGGGAYLGALEGAAFGAAVGSAFPGLGTAAGAVIGMVAGAGLGAGLGALITKYSAKVFSALTHPHALNPSNPEKYSLSLSQKEHLKQNGYDLDVIQKMIIAIKREKSKIGIAGSFPWTHSREMKNKWNDLLQQVKMGNIKEPIKIGPLFYDPLLSRFHAEKKHQTSYGKYLIPNMPEATDFKQTTTLKNESSTQVNLQTPEWQSELRSTGTEEYRGYPNLKP